MGEYDTIFLLVGFMIVAGAIVLKPASNVVCPEYNVSCSDIPNITFPNMTCNPTYNLTCPIPITNVYYNYTTLNITKYIFDTNLNITLESYTNDTLTYNSSMNYLGSGVYNLINNNTNETIIIRLLSVTS